MDEWSHHSGDSHGQNTQAEFSEWEKMPISGGECRNLTAGQLEIWHAQKLASDSSLYNVGEYLEINGDLDADLFEVALRVTIREAETFRIRLREDNELPQQYVHESDDWQLNFVDV